VTGEIITTHCDTIIGTLLCVVILVMYNMMNNMMNTVTSSDQVIKDFLTYSKNITLCSVICMAIFLLPKYDPARKKTEGPLMIGDRPTDATAPVSNPANPANPANPDDPDE
jgi:hypothetical protein